MNNIGEESVVAYTDQFNTDPDSTFHSLPVRIRILLCEIQRLGYQYINDVWCWCRIIALSEVVFVRNYKTS